MSSVKERVTECINVLQKSKSTRERKAAVKELAGLGLSAEAALSELMKIVNRKDDFAIQSLAEEAVVKIGEPALPALKKLLKAIQMQKRSKGLGLLGEIALTDKETINDVLALIEPLIRSDINYQVRLTAISVLRKLAVKYRNLPNIIELLGKVLRKERNFLVRREASEVLAEIDGKLAIKEIIKSMERKNYPFFRFSGETRTEAANALLTIALNKPKELKEVLPVLLAILENDPYPPMRISVLIPLIRIGGWAVIEDVLDIIVKDKWFQLRMSALDAAKFLVYEKQPSRSKIREILPIIKKLSREDKYEIVKDSARNLIDNFEELLKEEGELGDDEE